MFSWSIYSTTIFPITFCVWIQMVMMRNIYWFSMFMACFFIRIIFSVTWTWLVIFVRRIIIFVIPLFLYFSLLNLCFKVLSNFIIFGVLFFIGWFFLIIRIGILLWRSFVTWCKNKLLFFCGVTEILLSESVLQLESV